VNAVIPVLLQPYDRLTLVTDAGIEKYDPALNAGAGGKDVHINIWLSLIIVISCHSDSDVVHDPWLQDAGWPTRSVRCFPLGLRRGQPVLSVKAGIRRFSGSLHFSGVINPHVIMLAVTVVLYKSLPSLLQPPINIIARAPVISWLDKGHSASIIGLAEGFVFPVRACSSCWSTISSGEMTGTFT
jgi:hypothetical protein